MPWFTCDTCNDSIKKPKLASHFNMCRGYYFSCVDCLEVFDRKTVQKHSACVTEHEKYALGATKPGGFAASGMPASTVTGPKKATDSEPTGLQFLTTRTPWKCNLCNVNTTSQDTLMAHAAGLKHKRKVRAATGQSAGGDNNNATKAGENISKDTPVPAKGEQAGKGAEEGKIVNDTAQKEGAKAQAAQAEAAAPDKDAKSEKKKQKKGEEKEEAIATAQPVDAKEKEKKKKKDKKDKRKLEEAAVTENGEQEEENSAEEEKQNKKKKKADGKKKEKKTEEKIEEVAIDVVTKEGEGSPETGKKRKKDKKSSEQEEEGDGTKTNEGKKKKKKGGKDGTGKEGVNGVASDVQKEEDCANEEGGKKQKEKKEKKKKKAEKEGAGKHSEATLKVKTKGMKKSGSKLSNKFKAVTQQALVAA